MSTYRGLKPEQLRAIHAKLDRLEAADALRGKASQIPSQRKFDRAPRSAKLSTIMRTQNRARTAAAASRNPSLDPAHRRRMAELARRYQEEVAKMWESYRQTEA